MVGVVLAGGKIDASRGLLRDESAAVQPFQSIPLLRCVRNRAVLELSQEGRVWEIEAGCCGRCRYLDLLGSEASVVPFRSKKGADGWKTSNREGSCRSCGIRAVRKPLLIPDVVCTTARIFHSTSGIRTDQILSLTSFAKFNCSRKLCLYQDMSRSLLTVRFQADDQLICGSTSFLLLLTSFIGTPRARVSRRRGLLGAHR